MTSPPAAHAGRGFPWLVVAGVLVAALSLRGPIVAITPVLRQIEADLAIGSTTAGLLTTAPVLMFAVLTPMAALVIRRAGAELALLLSLSGVLVGTAIRALPGFASMMLGMVVIGAAITIGNVVIPVIIRRDVPAARVVLVTAAYGATLNLGSLLTSLLTAPIAQALGWSLALVVWSLITVLGLVLWVVHLRRSGDDRGERYSGAAPAGTAVRKGDLDPEALTGPLPVVAPGRGTSFLRRPVTWLLLLAFGGQTTIYYALSTWLPTFVSDELGLGASAAGALASLYQGVGILGAFVVPLLARFTAPLVPALVLCATWITLTVGMLTAPQLLWLWLSVGAIGHAGGFVVIFAALVGVARSDAEAAGMSALVQGGGYAMGALGGPIAGALHEATGGWDALLWMLLALAVAYCVLLLSAVLSAQRARQHGAGS
ncbi:CynX/NimT family MFS transporter [Microbacterium fluvii]|uniref:CynX/NimT family MFS transporter n=1 Tax=Microbacterium fluvii TaxID=415215 RepID=A0ABW2HFE8_9MICO|nr:MFS transporter [Microbacterium fluvii]MCU4673674.1 MFS transporter [Microbacterium fluvii]